MIARGSAVVALLLCGAASAQVPTHDTTDGSVTRILNSLFTYQVDDGSNELNVGLPGGGTIQWGNMFDVNASNTDVQSIEVGFGVDNEVPGGLVGTAYDWVIAGDNDADPTTGLTVLAAGAGVVVNDQFSVNGLVDVINVGSVDVSGFANLFVGFSHTHGASQFPAAQDTDSSAGRSWAGVNGADASDYSGTADLVDNLGLPGNWIIRANAVPTPGAAGVLALAGLGVARRRR